MDYLKKETIESMRVCVWVCNVYNYINTKHSAWHMADNQ